MSNETAPSHILLPLDALRFGEARARLAFQEVRPPTQLVPYARVWKLKMIVPRPILQHGQRRTFTVDLSVLGQLSRDHLEVETRGPETPDGHHRTTLRCWVEERRGPSSQVHWDNALKAVRELERLIDEPVDTTALLEVDEHTGTIRLRMRGVEVHRNPEDTHGFPLFDAEGDRIVMSAAAAFPAGVAMHIVFNVRCETNNVGGLSMRASLVSLSLV